MSTAVIHSGNRHESGHKSLIQDPWILGSVLLLILFGVVMVYSASITLAERNAGNSMYFLFRQTAHVVLGLGIMWIVAQSQLRFWEQSGPVLLLAAIALLIVVLIYVYPMRVMAGGMFSWFTGGYLPSNFTIDLLEELRFMFIFLGIGFVALCLVFVSMYRYVASLEHELRLNSAELHDTRTIQVLWLGAAVIGALSIVMASLVPERIVPWSGFVFALLGPWFGFISSRRNRARP